MLTKQNKTKGKISEKPHTFIMHSCFDSIRHLHISHNAPYLPSPPPKKKKIATALFSITKVMQNFGGQKIGSVGDVHASGVFKLVTPFVRKSMK